MRDEDAIEELVKGLDPENTGKFDFKALTQVMEEQLKEKDTKEDLIHHLKKLDKSGLGMIPAPEFKMYMSTLGMKMQPEDLEELMKIADPKGEGKIDLDDFAESLCPPRK